MKEKYNSTKLWKNIVVVVLVILYEQGIGYLLKYRNPPFIAVLYYLIEVPLFYIGSYAILPLIKMKLKRLIEFAISVTLSFVLFLLLQLLIGAYAVWQTKGILSFELEEPGFYRTLWRYLYIMALAYSYMVARISIIRERKASQTEITNLRLENENLKSRLEQHDLFNSMSAVYEIVEDVALEAARAVELQIKRTRYALATSQDMGYSLLSEEVENLKDCVELLQIRHKGKASINIKPNMDYASTGLAMPPAIMTNFLDNISKHGVLDDPNHPAVMHIIADGYKIRIRTSNLIKEEQGAGLGIGLETLRARLDRSHPGKYSLKTRTDHEIFYMDFEIEV